MTKAEIQQKILDTVYTLGRQEHLPVTEDAIWKSLKQDGIDKEAPYLEDLVNARLLYKEDFEDLKPGLVTYMYQLTPAGNKKRCEG